MVDLELLVTIETFANLLLISSVVIYAFLKREKLYSDEARMTIKANIGKIKIVIIFLFVSVFAYMVGEAAVLSASFNVLLPFPLTYDELHEGAEVVHLFLLFAGYAVGGAVLLKAVRDNGA